MPALPLGLRAHFGVQRTLLQRLVQTLSPVSSWNLHHQLLECFFLQNDVHMHSLHHQLHSMPHALLSHQHRPVRRHQALRPRLRSMHHVQCRYLLFIFVLSSRFTPPLSNQFLSNKIGEYIIPGRACNGSGFSDSSAGFCTPCRRSCTSGYFLSGKECTTGKELQDRTCSSCSVATYCPKGSYIFGRCDGTTTFDSRKCLPCARCLPGQIQTEFCLGNSTSDVTKCKACNITSPLACKPSHILVNQCTGTSSVDATRCLPCSPNNGRGCDTNQFVSRLCSSVLFPSNPAASIYDGRCSDCMTSCPRGQYMLLPCTTGRTNSDLVCANCSIQSCPAGFYVGNECNGSSTTDTAECLPCSCPAGQYLPFFNVTSPSSAASCNSTNPLLQGCTLCTLSSSCSAGFFLSGQCTTQSNPTCEPCRPSCGLAEVEAVPCSISTDRRCLPNPGCYQVLTMFFTLSTRSAIRH